VLAVFVRDHSSYPEKSVVAARGDVVRSDLPGTMAASLLPVIIVSSNAALNNDDSDDKVVSRQM
jgi:hypothetical protein